MGGIDRAEARLDDRVHCGLLLAQVPKNPMEVWPSSRAHRDRFPALRRDRFHLYGELRPRGRPKEEIVAATLVLAALTTPQAHRESLTTMAGSGKRLPAGRYRRPDCQEQWHVVESGPRPSTFVPPIDRR